MILNLNLRKIGMTRAELIEKIVSLLMKNFSGIIKIKIKDGKIIWAVTSEEKRL